MERVELFFTANNIPAEKKVPVFLSIVGGTTYGLLRNLLAPANPKDKSFKEIVDMLKAYFEPKPLVIAERFISTVKIRIPESPWPCMWLNSNVWLPIVLLKPIWRKRCVIVLSVVCAARVLRSDYYPKQT